MSDKEKTMKRLEECLSASCRGFRTCPYSDTEWDAVKAAYELLKEPEPSSWISVKDRLPEQYYTDDPNADFSISKDVLVATNGGIGFSIGRYETDYPSSDEATSYWIDWGYEKIEVTHWMPLQKPPEEVSGDV